MLSVILLSMLMILFSFYTTLYFSILYSELESDLWALWTGVRSGLLISMLGKRSCFCLTGLITMAFSSKLDWVSYIISISKTASKKIGPLIHSMKFLSPKVALYLYKSTIYPCMEYCCHVWVGAPSCYLVLLNKLQKQICMIAGPSLAASLEPGPFRRFPTHVWQNARVNIVRRVMVYDAYFAFPKIS